MSIYAFNNVLYLYNIGSGIASEDFAIDIPEIKDLSDYSEFLDGFDRGESW